MGLAYFHFPLAEVFGNYHHALQMKGTSWLSILWQDCARERAPACDGFEWIPLDYRPRHAVNRGHG